MARSTSALVERLVAFLPPEDGTVLEPLLGGLAAMFSQVESDGDALQVEATYEASGKWLTLQARGLGIERATGETDTDLRTRMRNAEDNITRASIQAAIDALLAPYTSDTALIIEWWEGPYLDHVGDAALWLDGTVYLSPGPHGVLIIVPRIGDAEWGGAYLDNVDELGAYLDRLFYLGSEAIEHPVYEAIWAEVERLRAAGVAVWMIIDDS